VRFLYFSNFYPIFGNLIEKINLNEFLYLTEYVAPKLKKSEKKTKEQALFIYLLWLRTGMTMEVNNY
jgi:hypothetical protein